MTRRTHLWVISNSCMAGRPIKDALVRCQYRLGLCPKMKYHPLRGWIFILMRRGSSCKLYCPPPAGTRGAPVNCRHRHRDSFRKLRDKTGIFAVLISDSVVFTTEFAEDFEDCMTVRVFLPQRFSIPLFLQRKSKTETGKAPHRHGAFPHKG